MLGKVSRLIVSASLLGLLASCNSLGFGDGESKSAAPATASNGAPLQPNGNAQIMPLSPANPTSNQTPIGTGVTAQGSVAPVVQGACPQIFMRDQDAIYRTFSKGAKKGDPDQVVFQAAFGDYTRQCTLNDSALSMTIAAQLRLVAGPGGAPGPVTLPIRISVLDGQDIVSSEVVNFPAQIPPGSPGTQVVFRKDGIKMPVGSGALLRVNIGFDQKPLTKPKGNKNS